MSKCELENISEEIKPAKLRQNNFLLHQEYIWKKHPMLPILTRVTRKQTLRSLSLSYPSPSSGSTTTKTLRSVFFVTRIRRGLTGLLIHRDEFLSFDIHCEAISNSAGRALGRIISKFSYFRNVGFKTFNKLFECNVESVMSYGVANIGLKEFGFEKIQSRAIRYFLGVHPKTPIPALFGEVGWTQFKYKRWIGMCRTWNRFIEMDDDRVNKQIFIRDYTANTPNWSKDFQTVCSLLDFNDAFVNMSVIDLDLFKERLKLHVSEKWKTSVLSKPKLRTYQLYKKDLKPEWYVENFVGRFQRSIFARFRCGVLPLQIEVGRFRGQSVEQRICQLCKNAVESEIHFLLECPVYDRDEFFRLTTLNLVPDNVDQIRLCMENYQKLTVKFVTKLWNERQNLITN